MSIVTHVYEYISDVRRRLYNKYNYFKNIKNTNDFISLVLLICIKHQLITHS